MITAPPVGAPRAGLTTSLGDSNGQNWSFTHSRAGGGPHSSRGCKLEPGSSKKNLRWSVWKICDTDRVCPSECQQGHRGAEKGVSPVSGERTGMFSSRAGQLSILPGGKLGVPPLGLCMTRNVF